MTSVRVNEVACACIGPGQEQCGYGRLGVERGKMTVDRGRNSCRVVQRSGEETNETHQVSEPHPGAQAFSGNVSETQHGVDARVKGRQEIARSVAHGEGLTGNIEGPAAKAARGAQPLLDVGRFKEPKL